VTVIRFDRPEVMNCIGLTTHNELVHAWDTFRDDEQRKVAIITGAGDKAFCAGGDLTGGVNLTGTDVSSFDRPADSVLASHERGEQPGVLGPSRWTDIYKPIIAAVNGVAYAGGLEWACYADIRIAEAHASFKEAAVRGFGKPLDEGLRIEAECFHKSFFHPDTIEGLRRFRKRDHPDRTKDRPAKTPGIVRS
jgi:enoyl-CoA hydratase/carnithine racemase